MENELNPEIINRNMNKFFELVNRGMIVSSVIEGPKTLEGSGEPINCELKVGFFRQPNQNFLVCLKTSDGASSLNISRRAIKRIASIDIDKRINLLREMNPHLDVDILDDKLSNVEFTTLNCYPEMMIVLGETSVSKVPASLLITLKGVSPIKALREFHQAAQAWVKEL